MFKPVVKGYAAGYIVRIASLFLFAIFFHRQIRLSVCCTFKCCALVAVPTQNARAIIRKKQEVNHSFGKCGSERNERENAPVKHTVAK